MDTVAKSPEASCVRRFSHGGLTGVRLLLEGKPVVLVDTPGFDDSYRSDTMTLDRIGEWLREKCVSNGFTLSEY